MGKQGEQVAIEIKFGWVLNGPLNENLSKVIRISSPSWSPHIIQ